MSPAALALVAALAAQDPGSVTALRDAVEAAAADGISAGELEELAAEGLRLAEAGGSRRALWSALGPVADLCALGPFEEARAVRSRALELLARRDSDTLRWSSLVTRSFLPAYGRMTPEQRAGEMKAYEDTLTALAAEAESERVQAELTYARAFGRVFINRRWEGLSEAQRRETLALLDELARRFGHLPLPGSARPETETVAQRARSHEHELTRLYFGAPAPPTSGVDLEGAPFDLAELRGRVVVLDFWTSFCQPCLALVPGTLELLSELDGESATYVGVCGDTDRLAGAATAERVGMTWRNLWDGGSEGPAATTWNVPALGWPSVFVLDAEGRIRRKLRGKEQIEAELGEAVKALLAERQR